MTKKEDEREWERERGFLDNNVGGRGEKEKKQQKKQSALRSGTSILLMASHQRSLAVGYSTLHCEWEGERQPAGESIMVEGGRVGDGPEKKRGRERDARLGKYHHRQKLTLREWGGGREEREKVRRKGGLMTLRSVGPMGCSRLRGDTPRWKVKLVPLRWLPNWRAHHPPISCLPPPDPPLPLPPSRHRSQLEHTAPVRVINCDKLLQKYDSEKI